MPKPKPDNVVRHEVVLGRAEREIIRDAQMAYAFNRIASPITGMSASGYVVVGGGLLVLIDALLDRLGMDPNWREIIAEMTPEQVHDWLETQNLILGGIGAIIGFFLGGPYGAVAGGVVGSGAAEGGEEIWGWLPDWLKDTQGAGYSGHDPEDIAGTGMSEEEWNAAIEEAYERDQKRARMTGWSLISFRGFLRSLGDR